MTATTRDRMSSVVPIASIEPDSSDHLCSGLRVLQAIAGDDPNWADLVGGMQAYRGDENCILMHCPPFEAANVDHISDECSVVTISDDNPLEVSPREVRCIFTCLSLTALN